MDLNDIEVVKNLAEGKTAYLTSAREIWNRHDISMAQNSLELQYLYQVFECHNPAEKEIARLKLLGPITTKTSKPQIF